MATEFEFSFSPEFLQLGIKKMDAKLNRAAFGVCKYWDSRIESHMKHKAPWKDRTTNARNGLFANAVKVSKRTFAIILAHSVTYGIYLERAERWRRETGDTPRQQWSVDPHRLRSQADDQPGRCRTPALQQRPA